MSGSYSAFVLGYDAGAPDPSSLLMAALSNADPAARVAIAVRLLDDGADASLIQGGNSTINVLLGQPEHDAELEAPLLQRLIDGGADVNHPSRRGDAPVVQLLNAEEMRDAEMVPFYDVVFARPELDLEAPAAPEATRSIREAIHAPGGFIRKRMRERAPLGT